MNHTDPIVAHYENCFSRFGRSAKGVDWPNETDLVKRFEVMTNLFRSEILSNERVSVLDLGCGPGLYVDYLKSKDIWNKVDYLGVDLSETLLSSARSAHPETRFLNLDILRSPLNEPIDYVVANGLLTEKVSLTHSQMLTRAQKLVRAAYHISKKGLAFNAMSECVDWKRDDLFYWGFSELSQFLKSDCSRHFEFIQSYGLYEFTTYVYRSQKR